MGARNATAVLAEGQNVIVDATRGVVFQGEAKAAPAPEAVGESLRPFDDKPDLRRILSLDEFVDVLVEAFLQLLRSDGAAALKDAQEIKVHYFEFSLAGE